VVTSWPAARAESSRVNAAGRSPNELEPTCTRCSAAPVALAVTTASRIGSSPKARVWTKTGTPRPAATAKSRVISSALAAGE